MAFKADKLSLLKIEIVLSVTLTIPNQFAESF